MAIAATLVKELRERTGAGMMECKKALVEANGDIELALENMRKAGQAKADKKAGRVAAEGLVGVYTESNMASIVEINSETDFVARNDDFKAFVDVIAGRVLQTKVTEVAALLEQPLQNGADETIEAARQELVTKIGENISLRRADMLIAAEGGHVASYIHGGRIGVIVQLDGGDEALAKDLAMHIAASRPQVVNPEEVPADLIEKEKEIFSAQAAQSGKPAEIIEKMVDGRIKKFLNEVSLVGQPYIKDPNQTVGALLKETKAKVAKFVRFEVGEGIEKQETDFAEEVMAQAQGV